jgi:hypothetical protein
MTHGKRVCLDFVVSKNPMKKTTHFICAFLSMAAPSMAATTIAEWNFNTNGDAEGWTPSLNSSALTVASGLLTGTATNNDPQLGRSGLTLSLGIGQTWDQLVFRVRETQDEAPAGTVSTFNGTGLVMQLNNSGAAGFIYNAPAAFTGVASGDGFFTVSLNISALPSDTTITSLRFDPIGGAASNSNSETNGNTFEVDSISVTAIPEPSSALLGGLGLLCLLRRRR